MLYNINSTLNRRNRTVLRVLVLKITVLSIFKQEKQNTMKIKRNYLFIPDKEKGKTDSKLRFRIRYDGKTVAFNVGYRVDNEKWIADAQRCKANTTHGKKKVPASTINAEISRCEEIADRVFFMFENAGISPSANDFRAEYNKLQGKEDKVPEKGLFYCLNRFILEYPTETSLSGKSIEKYIVLKSSLKKFSPELQFADLNVQGITSYVNFLVERGMANRTALRTITTLKTFLSWCVSHGYSNDTEFKKFKPHLKTVPKTVIFLTWEELIKVYNCTLTREALIRAREAFCFQCFTSLRYSDVKNLSWADVKEDCITITTVKTADSLSINLNKYSRAILDRMPRTQDKVFPIPKVNRYNTHLREIWKECCIDTLVRTVSYTGAKRVEKVNRKYELATSHAGRRTFICNALMLGIPPNIVMKWTGHSDYKAMQPYIDVTDKAKQNAMKLFDV